MIERGGQDERERYEPCAKSKRWRARTGTGTEERLVETMIERERDPENHRESNA